jgi:DNA-nicking Smr family endonuclease
MRRRTTPKLSDEDIALWSHVARSVRAFAGRSAPDLPEPPAPPPETGLPAPERAARLPSAPKSPPISPIERRTLTALKRGRLEVEAVIDLHGLRQDEAHARLTRFLRREQARGTRFVLVITGKGAAGAAGSVFAGDERGVLKRMTPHWLRSPELRPVVSGFEEANLNHGGAGALYVRLRRIRDTGMAGGA